MKNWNKLLWLMLAMFVFAACGDDDEGGNGAIYTDISECYPMGTAWEEVHYSPFDHSKYVVFRYTVNGTKEIDGTHYKTVKVEVARCDTVGVGTKYPWGPFRVQERYLREEHGKVYGLRYTDDNDEHLMFDFNWDMTKEYTYIQLGDGYKYASTKGESDPYKIQTIGSTFGIFTSIDPLAYSMQYGMVAFWRKGKLLFKNPDMLRYME